MDFKDLIDGTQEIHGPYDSYEEAYDVWNSRAWSTVDDCQARFTIVNELPEIDSGNKMHKEGAS